MVSAAIRLDSPSPKRPRAAVCPGPPSGPTKATLTGSSSDSHAAKTSRRISRRASLRHVAARVRDELPDGRRDRRREETRRDLVGARPACAPRALACRGSRRGARRAAPSPGAARLPRAGRFRRPRKKPNSGAAACHIAYAVGCERCVRRSLEQLRDKYREMLSMRLAHASGDESESGRARSDGRAGVRAFPGRCERSTTSSLTRSARESGSSIGLFAAISEPRRGWRRSRSFTGSPAERSGPSAGSQGESAIEPIDDARLRRGRVEALAYRGRSARLDGRSGRASPRRRVGGSWTSCSPALRRRWARVRGRRGRLVFGVPGRPPASPNLGARPR